MKPVDIVFLVARRRWLFESKARDKNIRLSFSCNEALFVSAVDEAMMEKVTDSLLHNAVEYSRPSGEVFLILTCGTENWTLEVNYPGVDTDKKMSRKPFGRFLRNESRADSSADIAETELFPAKNYVAMHGGILTRISRENADSTIKIVVPVMKIGGDEGYESETSQTSRKTESETNVENEVEPKNCKPVEKTTNVRPRTRLLIVEGDDDLRNFMRHALGDEFKVFAVSDGSNAWDVVRRRLPDMIVSGVMMSGIDGFELCRLVKSTYETSHIPVVLLTSLTEKARQLQALRLGADDYLTKPFDMDLLVQRIKSIIRNRRAIREKALKMLDGDREETLFGNESNDLFVKDAVEVVRANMGNRNFGKEEFAVAMNISSSLLYKKLKSLTGLSIVDFIKSIRLNHASELLKTRKHTVTEISEMCGFSSLGYFSATFKKHFGKTPMEL